MYICDVEECFVLAKTIWFSSLCLVDVSEALGLCQAMQWVADLGFDGTDFSLDSKIVLDVFNRDNNNNDEFGNIIHHCRQLFNTSFNNSKVKFSPRQKQMESFMNKQRQPH